MSDPRPDWHEHGVRIVRRDQLDFNTPQTPGMNRAAAINRAMAGANKLWAGTVTILPDAKTGPHHHGALESIIYVLQGRARMRWGEQLEYYAEAGGKRGRRQKGSGVFLTAMMRYDEVRCDTFAGLNLIV